MVTAFQLNYCYSNCYRRLLKTSWHLIGDGILDKSIGQSRRRYASLLIMIILYLQYNPG